MCTTVTYYVVSLSLCHVLYCCTALLEVKTDGQRSKMSSRKINWYKTKTCRMVSMLGLTFSFFLCEIVFGYITNSLALIGDSYHMLSDVMALLVGLTSLRVWYVDTVIVVIIMLQCQEYWPRCLFCFSVAIYQIMQKYWHITNYSLQWWKNRLK